jgi:hypothetical protein
MHRENDSASSCFISAATVSVSPAFYGAIMHYFHYAVELNMSH